MFTNITYFHLFPVLEWIDWDVVERVIIIVLDTLNLRINVNDTKSMLLRFIDVKQAADKNSSIIELHVSSDREENLLTIKLPREYDLVSCEFYNKQVHVQ